MPSALVNFCRVIYRPQATMFQEGYQKDTEKAISPDITTVRYGRTWRFSKPEIEEDMIMGRLGYIASPNKIMLTFYDEEKKDFVDQAVDFSQINYVHWVLSYSNHVLAFETKPPLIRAQSFIGAFNGLLGEHPEIGLTTEYITEPKKFFDWVNEVDRVYNFTANIRTPNPKYPERTDVIYALLKATNADSARIELKKEKGNKGSLDTNTTIKQFVDYGYSEVKAHGMKNEQERDFSTKFKTPTERVTIQVPIIASAVWKLLIEALRKYKP